MALPKYLTKLSFFKARFRLDPDQFYPSLLQEFSALYQGDKKATAGRGYSDLLTDINSEDFSGLFFGTVDTKTPDRYWLEVCHQIVKIDSLLALRSEKLSRKDVSTVFVIQGSKPGYATRWSLKSHPEGDRYAALLEKYQESSDPIREVDKRIAVEARKHYKNLRGFFPEGL